MPRTAYKRYTLEVFIPARSLPDEHQLGFRVAIGEDQIRRGSFEIAAVEPRQCLLQFVHCGGGLGGRLSNPGGLRQRRRTDRSGRERGRGW